MTNNSNKIYDMVTDRIIKQMESIEASNYTKPWFNVGYSPRNIISGKTYRGINLLTLSGYDSNHFGTFKQWKDKGCTVTKGEKSNPVIKWTFFSNGEALGPDDSEKITGVSIKYFSVFNSSQVKGDYARELENKPAKQNKNDIIQSCERVSNGYIKNELIRVEKSDRACHIGNAISGHTTYIEMPEITQFKDSESYYATFFHEIGHSTGASNRLNRKLGNKFGSSDYAYEELIAELTAAMLMAEQGGQAMPRVDHAQYLKGWIKALKNDNKFIVSASQNAQKACDYINMASDNYNTWLDKQAA